MKRQYPYGDSGYSGAPSLPVKRISMLSNTPKQKKDQIQTILHQSRQKLLHLVHKGRGELRRYVMLKNLYRHMKTELEECSYNTCARYRRYWNSCVSGLYGTECPPEAWEDTETNLNVGDNSFDFDMFNVNPLETQPQAFAQTSNWFSAGGSSQPSGYEHFPGNPCASNMSQLYASSAYNSCAVSSRTGTPYTSYGYNNLQPQAYKPAPDCNYSMCPPLPCSYSNPSHVDGLTALPSAGYHLTSHTSMFETDTKLSKEYQSYTDTSLIPKPVEMESTSEDEDDESCEQDMYLQSGSSCSYQEQLNQDLHAHAQQAENSLNWFDLKVPSFDLVVSGQNSLYAAHSGSPGEVCPGTSSGTPASCSLNNNDISSEHVGETCCDTCYTTPSATSNTCKMDDFQNPRHESLSNSLQNTCSDTCSETCQDTCQDTCSDTRCASAPPVCNLNSSKSGLSECPSSYDCSECTGALLSNFCHSSLVACS